MSQAISPVIEVKGLSFRYANDQPPVLRDLHLSINRGQRCLLVGANGAGKTTLLRLIGGKHMIDDDQLRVLGQPAFHDTSLVGRVAFLGGSFPIDVDIRVREILVDGTQADADPARRDKLVEILGVDLDWRMHRVSDGQRRRVQLLLGLLRRREVLLLDEITTDLDLLARADLLAFLREESETRGVTVLYATHILDRLEQWATDIAFIDGGQIRLLQPLTELAALDELRAQGLASPLTHLVERWLRNTDA